jgi:23S rRNA (guanine745-N1)-methyltransferase
LFRLDRSSVLDAFPLTCPICQAELGRHGGCMRCRAMHSFDISRHGYVNLAAGRPLAGDTAGMAAERHAFLSAGHFEPVSRRVAGHAARELPAERGLVVDVGGGTGQHLAYLLDRVRDARGLVVDASAAALRRAARVHPRAAAAGWDVWGRWPLASDSIDLLLNMFAPRNAAEFHRVLRPAGVLVVVAPTPRHLVELREVVPLLAVDARKPERLAQALTPGFMTAAHEEVTFSMRLSPADVRRAVAMGPSARHLGDAAPPADGTRVVTASVVVTLYRKR